MSKKLKKYEITTFKGVLGDFATEWWTDSDWKDWEIYVENLKRTGEYGKEHKIDLLIEPDPLYDDNKIYPKTPSESYRMTFLDVRELDINKK